MMLAPASEMEEDDEMERYKFSTFNWENSECYVSRKYVSKQQAIAGLRAFLRELPVGSSGFVQSSSESCALLRLRKGERVLEVTS